MAERPIVRRLDHVNIVVPRPRALFDVLTRELGIPIERPWARFPAFESGQAMLGIGHEPITYAPGRKTGVPDDAGLFALAFEPEPVARAREELARRQIPHSIPFEFDVTYPDHPDALALDEAVGEGQRRRRWTLITVGGMIGDETSARELSRWPRRGDGWGAETLGRIVGRLGSGRLGGPLMARLGSTRPFVFLCGFESFDVAESRVVATRELARRGGGPLGLRGTREIIVTARDAACERHRWQQLLAPTQPDELGRWWLGDGPTLRLVEGPADAIEAVVWEVGSLAKAAEWLTAKGWLGSTSDEEISISPEPLQGLDVRLAPSRSSGSGPATGAPLSRIGEALSAERKPRVRPPTGTCAKFIPKASHDRNRPPPSDTEDYHPPVDVKVRYARNGEVAIGYAVLGDGPADLVYVPPHNNLDLAWENPHYARFLREVASFSRLIVVDRRGTGISDRYSPHDLPTLEDLVDDLDAVLDAAGSEHAALFGYSDGGALCAMFAATRPDRVSGLILHATAACGRQAPDYPWQWSDEEWREYLDELRDPSAGYGTRAYAEATLPLFAPSLAGDQRMVAWWERFQRASASPSALAAQEAVFQKLDIRGMLGSIGVPTLVLHRSDDAVEPVGAGRYLRQAISSAEYVELPGADHLPWTAGQEDILSEIRRFLDRLWEEEEETLDRVLATVLFTDIVDSTTHAATMGDQHWREVREQHDRQIRAQLARYRGREVKTMGDGFLATFDGPARALRCASTIREAMKRLGVELRAGLHTGEIQLDGDDVSGIAVAIGARISALAGPGEVLVSSTVKDLVVGSRMTFNDRGTHRLKGVPEAWHLYGLREREGSPAA